MVETLSELHFQAANVAVLIAEAYALGMDKATKLLTEDANNC